MRVCSVGHHAHPRLWQGVEATLMAAGHVLVDEGADVVLAWTPSGLAGLRSPAVAVVLDERGWPHVAGRRPRGRGAADSPPPAGGGRPGADAGTPVVRWLAASSWVRETIGRPDAEVVLPGVDARFEQRFVLPWRWRLACFDAGAAAAAVAALPELPEARLVVDGAQAPSGDRVRVQRSPDEALVEAFASADAVICGPEPWCRVPLQAMAVGRPVIALAGQGVAEPLREGENALLVEPGDVVGLAAAVRRLAAEEPLRARLRVGGIETVEHHSAPAFAAAVVGALEDVAAAGSPPVG